jgi:crotonobetainyl-CoA:carnitine CoA-transferase CaiB-like acyl-CoA transferase
MTIDTLAGYTVVELTAGVAGAYATKLFADAGADVIVIEPVGGSALRRMTRSGPLPEDGADGPLFRWLAAGKRCAVGDHHRPDGPQLVRSAHVVSPISRRGHSRKPGCSLDRAMSS